MSNLALKAIEASNRAFVVAAAVVVELEDLQSSYLEQICTEEGNLGVHRALFELNIFLEFPQKQGILAKSTKWFDNEGMER